MCALAQFVEQSRVLDGDDSLSGEVRDKLDLLVGKWTHLLTIDGNRADNRFSVFEHWDGDQRPNAPNVHRCNSQRIALDIGAFLL